MRILITKPGWLYQAQCIDAPDCRGLWGFLRSLWSGVPAEFPVGRGHTKEEAVAWLFLKMMRAGHERYVDPFHYLEIETRP